MTVDLAEVRLVQSLRFRRIFTLEVLFGFQMLLELLAENKALQQIRGESCRDLLRHFDTTRTHQDRLLLGEESQQFPGHASELSFLGLVNNVGLINTSGWSVGRNRDHVEAVNLSELVFFRLRRTGHAAQLVVESEQVLERDGGHGLALLLNLNPFFGFQRLVQTVAVAAAKHHAARVLVDDDHFALTHHVVHVAIKKRVRLHRRIDVVEQLGIGRDVVDAQ